VLVQYNRLSKIPFSWNDGATIATSASPSTSVEKRTQADRILSKSADDSSVADAARRRRLLWVYASAATSGAATIAAAVLYGVGYSARANSLDAYHQARSQSEIDSHWRHVQRAEVLAGIGHGAAGLALVASGVALYNYLMLRKSGAPARDQTLSPHYPGSTVAIVPLAGGSAFSVQGSF
jgi:hypothetical protein